MNSPDIEWAKLVPGFPNTLIRGILLFGTLLFLAGIADAYGLLDLAPLTLTRMGCLMTVHAAFGEWRIIQWQLKNAAAVRSFGDVSADIRQVAKTYEKQRRSAIGLMHALFLLGTIAWGFGDLI